MPLTHEQVVHYVREHGPAVPNEIRQALQAKDNFIIGAMLSELVGQGKLAMTDMSLGTSKFYYDPTMPEILEKVSQHLGEKDLRTYQQLKSEKVLRHAALTPLLRLSLSNIKDYSRQLRIRTDEGEEVFWHYYLISSEEAFELIKQRFYPKKQEKPAEKPKEETKQHKEEQKVLEPKKKEAKTEPKEAKQGDFAKQVHEYFDQKKIALVQSLLIKKNELSFIVSMPTPVGSVKYFCKAKSKKTTNEGDLAAAHLEAQQHKLPLLYVAGGKLTKKAIETQQTNGLVVVQPWA